MRTPLALRRLVLGRFGGVSIFFALFLGCSFLTRGALLAKAAGDVSWDSSLLAVFGVGFLFDLGAAAWFSLPLVVALMLLPATFLRRPWARRVTNAVLFLILVVLVFDGVSEWFFWDEFGARFNFIAVDYLVYTTEVLANIRESYPLPLILPAVGLCSALILWGISRSGLVERWVASSELSLPSRLQQGGLLLTVLLALGLALSTDMLPRFENNYNRGLAGNGPWSLFAAFRNNELPYDEFYITVPDEQAMQALNVELTEDGSRLLDSDDPGVLRYVPSDGPTLKPNIIQITVESLSGEFLAALNPQSRLTPNLNALVEKSLFFDNFFATGTRTVRGMEALTLAVPPTPGRSVVKRPHNGGLFTLGSVLNAAGYETMFMYGGYGYFDNMNEYFSGNGYRVIDRASVDAQDVTFANAWGACDQDLLRWTLREADEASERGKPFHIFTMTTSNHRPYTYPEGCIDLPSKVSGRDGAVKYTDFAIGEFLDRAATRPWFKDTVFVIVADHCAGSAGRTEIPLERYHIPLLIYAPGGQIAAGRNSTLMSQIDYAPTLLGLLNWEYASRFFGHDVTRIEPALGHALVGTYQLLGHMENHELTVLEPKRGSSVYDVDSDDLDLHARARKTRDYLQTVGFYQSAARQFELGQYTALSAAQQERYCLQGRALLAAEAAEAH